MLLVLLSVVWGGSFFFNGIALREFPTLSIVTARVGLAALALLFLTRMLGHGIQLNRQILKAFFGMSFLNNLVPFSLIVWGQQNIASGVASILNATTPLFTTLVAHWFTTDEKINPRRLLGVLTGVGGVGLMMGLDSIESSGFHLLGQFAILLAAFSYGLAGVYGKRFGQLGIPPLATATGQLCASSMILLPLTLWIDQPWTKAMPSIEGMGSLFGIALLSTALAYVIYFRLLKNCRSNKPAAGDFIDPGQRDHPGSVPSGRKSRTTTSLRNGRHQPWTPDHGWAFAPVFSKDLSCIIRLQMS